LADLRANGRGRGTGEIPVGGIGSGFIVAMLSGLASWFRHQLAEPPASRREAADEGQKKKRAKREKNVWPSTSS